MRTYLILKEKATKFNANPEILALLDVINEDDGSMTPYFGKYDARKADALKTHYFDRETIAKRGLKYEQLDQLTVDLLLDVD